jgi:hypothetical protein
MPPVPGKRDLFRLRRGGYFAERPLYNGRTLTWLFALAALLVVSVLGGVVLNLLFSVQR